MTEALWGELVSHAWRELRPLAVALALPDPDAAVTDALLEVTSNWAEHAQSPVRSARRALLTLVPAEPVAASASAPDESHGDALLADFDALPAQQRLALALPALLHLTPDETGDLLDLTPDRLGAVTEAAHATLAARQSARHATTVERARWALDDQLRHALQSRIDRAPAASADPDDLLWAARQTRRRRRRRRLFIGALMVTVLLAVAAAGASWWLNRPIPADDPRWASVFHWPARGDLVGDPEVALDSPEQGHLLFAGEVPDLGRVLVWAQPGQSLEVWENPENPMGSIPRPPVSLAVQAGEGVRRIETIVGVDRLLAVQIAPRRLLLLTTPDARTAVVALGVRLADDGTVTTRSVTAPLDSQGVALLEVDQVSPAQRVRRVDGPLEAQVWSQVSADPGGFGDPCSARCPASLLGAGIASQNAWTAAAFFGVDLRSLIHREVVAATRDLGGATRLAFGCVETSTDQPFALRSCQFEVSDDMGNSSTYQNPELVRPGAPLPPVVAHLASFVPAEPTGQAGTGVRRLLVWAPTATSVTTSLTGARRHVVSNQLAVVDVSAEKAGRGVTVTALRGDREIGRGLVSAEEVTPDDLLFSLWDIDPGCFPAAGGSPDLTPAPGAACPDPLPRVGAAQR